MNKTSLRIALLGGGTGSFTLLQEIKNITPNLTALVNMCDDGGSSGDLRDELGVLPPGDARQCLVALSDSPEVRNLFSYRFASGRNEGQSLGNIILSGLELQYGSFDKAVEVASKILKIKGRVVPITLGNHILVMKDGEETIEGEYVIGSRKIKSKDAKVLLKPDANINPDAKKAIAEADIIIIAPGNLYGSLLPIFAVNGVSEAIAKAKATLVLVTNIVNKPGQTDNWHTVDYVHKIEEYIGKNQIDYVLYNSGPLSLEVLKRYSSEGEFPVSTDQNRFGEINAKAVGAALVSNDVIHQDPNDKAIIRTLIRHDAKKVAEQILKIY